MSTIILRKMKKALKIAKKSQLVIIKGLRGEPEALNYERIDNLFVTVVGKSGKTQMRLKIRYVYQYDEETYQKLRKAFDSNDTEALEQEWQKAKPIALT